MNTNLKIPLLKRSRPRWRFQRYTAAWLSTLALCLLGGFLTARGQDPYLPNLTLPMDTNVCVGATVSFRVIANTTNPPLTYQWQHEGTNLSAATNAVLVLSNLTLTHAGGYMAWVSNASGGFTNSRTATLTVHPAQFEDVTVSAGVTNAPGYCISAAWGDYNNDQFIDLYLAIGANTTGRNALFRNNGNGTFTRVGAGDPIATDVHDSGGCAWIDFNNDGYRDMFVLNGGWAASRNDLYWNNGDGTFRSGNAGNLTQLSQFRSWSACADYDNDGWVDIYVAEAPSWPGTITQRLYHATSFGTFESVDFGPTVSYVNDAVWGDYDNDGDVDLFVCGYTSPSRLYRNDGGSIFTAMANGLPTGGDTLHAAWADYDRDGDLDIALSSFSETRLYQNHGPSGFTLATNLNGAVAGGAWADYDNDGYLDLLIVGGQNTARKAGLYHNDGDGNFSRVSDIFTEVANNWLACPWGDFDNDGFMDVILTHQYGQHRLYRNLGNTNRWIKFKLVGTASNRDAIGAKVRVQATIGGQSVWQMQEVNGGYAMQNDTRLNFGLGDATNVDLVRIEWPSGNVQELSAQSADRIVTVTEQALITPVRPTASLNGSATLSRTALAGATYQWRFDGADLVGQTNRILNLTNITADMAGRYSVVASNATTLTTNFVYLFVDTQFSKITTGPVVNDPGNTYVPSWGDYDGDGWLDLFVANGGNEGPSLPFIYRNDQLGGFLRVSQAEVGDMALDRVQACEGIWADYDNDGDQDLFIGSSSLSSPNRFYLNDGNNRFVRVTNDVGINRALYPWGSAWADFDNDGLVDLYMASGWLSSGTKDSLWRNLGNGSFQQCKSIMFPAMDVNFGAWGDADNDGDLELLVGGAGSSYNAFFRNNGDGTFITDPSAGLGGGQACMPVWADFNNDGYLDVFLAHPSVPCYYYLNNKNGTFQRITTGPHTQTMGIIATAGDFDNDGDIDLFITRGAGSGDPSLLFRNEGDGTFVSITCGSLTQDRGHFSDCAWADYDNDGSLDLVVTTVANEKNSLFHNNGSSNGWLIVRLVGTRSNRDAIGAKVRASATVWGRSTMQTRQIGGGALGDPRAHFGLGNATKVTTLRIEWPSGAIQQFQNVATNQILTVREPPALTGAVRADGACVLTIKAGPNQVWEIQASSDLLTWQPLTTVTNATYQFQFTDPAAAGMNCRFYRVESK